MICKYLLRKCTCCSILCMVLHYPCLSKMKKKETRVLRVQNSSSQLWLRSKYIVAFVIVARLPRKPLKGRPLFQTCRPIFAARGSVCAPFFKLYFLACGFSGTPQVFFLTHFLCWHNRVHLPPQFPLAIVNNVFKNALIALGRIAKFIVTTSCSRYRSQRFTICTKFARFYTKTLFSFISLWILISAWTNGHRI